MFTVQRGVAHQESTCELVNIRDSAGTMAWASVLAGGIAPTSFLGHGFGVVRLCPRCSNVLQLNEFASSGNAAFGRSIMASGFMRDCDVYSANIDAEYTMLGPTGACLATGTLSFPTRVDISASMLQEELQALLPQGYRIESTLIGPSAEAMIALDLNADVYTQFMLQRVCVHLRGTL